MSGPVVPRAAPSAGPRLRRAGSATAHRAGRCAPHRAAGPGTAPRGFGAVRRAGVEAAAVLLPAAAVLLGHPPFGWSVAAGLVACAVLPLRHLSAPLAVAGTLWGLAGGLGWPAAVVALYALGRRADRVPAVLAWAALPVVASVVPVLVTQPLPWSDAVLALAFVVLYAGAPTALGLLVATRARLVESLREVRTMRESALAARAEAARAEERARIGREIHDAVGHHATLIAVGAAALAASTREEETRRGAEQLRGLARRALGEMRSALGLADRGPDTATGAGELGALVAGSRAAGVDVRLAHDGEPGELPVGVGRAVYRVVQESLTNAVRHAPGSAVRIGLEWRESELRVSVVNSEPPRRRRRERLPGGGVGLAGLAERVGSVGGTITAAPLGGGFAVRATFPRAVRVTTADPANLTGRA